MDEPQVPDPADVRCRARLRTRWSDEDTQRVLNNAVYLTLLEEARYTYFSRLGLIEDNHFPFLLAQCNLRFLAPGRGGADVEVQIATVHLGTSSFRQGYRVAAVSGGAIWAEAEALLVCYDPRSGRSVPMASEFRRALQEFEQLA